MNILFNKKFYSLGAIKRTIKDYKDLAVFEIKDEKNNIRVKMDNIDKDVKDIIKDEFCNYVLSETKRFR